MDGLCNLLAQAAGWNRAAFCGGDEDERHHSQVANDRRGHQAQLHHAGAFPKVERADDDGDADYRRKDQSAGQSGVACAAEAGGLCAVHQREQPDCDCRSQGQSARRGGRTAASLDVCADARRSLRVQLERRRFPGARLPDGYRARHRHGGFPDAGRAVRALSEGSKRRRGPDAGRGGHHRAAVLFEPEHLSAPLLSARRREPHAGRHRPRAEQDSACHGDGHGQDLHRVPDRLPPAAQRHEKENPVSG